MKTAKFHHKIFDAEKIKNSHPDYQPLSWPEDWEIVYLDNFSKGEIIRWCQQHISGNMELSAISLGTGLVAFSDPTDATLFRLSYEPNTYTGV